MNAKNAKNDEYVGPIIIAESRDEKSISAGSQQAGSSKGNMPPLEMNDFFKSTFL